MQICLTKPCATCVFCPPHLPILDGCGKTENATPQNPEAGKMRLSATGLFANPQLWHCLGANVGVGCQCGRELAKNTQRRAGRRGVWGGGWTEETVPSGAGRGRPFPAPNGLRVQLGHDAEHELLVAAALRGAGRRDKGDGAARAGPHAPKPQFPIRGTKRSLHTERAQKSHLKDQTIPDMI